MHYFFTSILLFISLSVHAIDVIVNMNRLNNSTQEIAIICNLDSDELLYKDSITISVDSPSISLSPWKSNKEAVYQYDTLTKQTKYAFDKECHIALTATRQKDTITDTALHVILQTNKQEFPVHSIHPLVFEEKKEEHREHINQEQERKALSGEPLKNSYFSLLLNPQKWSSAISQIVKTTQSLPIRLILVFLLGILLSLTPCIYPMIPITVGILQTQKSTSLFSNFLRSIAYTCGISLTFACFGLAASFTGPLYGKLLMSPLSVGVLALFLSYLALSMLGLYDLYVPRKLQVRHSLGASGSIFSSFIFGVASGTIASPCVSPGLILLLSIVATLNNLFLGFLLLFAFGIGLSTPLLLIGTFSTSLDMLPRAGMWMVEIKKVVGIMLFGVCFYYLSNIFSYLTLMYVMSASCAGIGLYYFWQGHQAFSGWIKKFNTTLGFVFLIGSILICSSALQTHFLSPLVMSNKSDIWYTDYESALQQAHTKHKLLFLDFWAEYCSICKAIDKKIFSNNAVLATLKAVIPVKINGTIEENPFALLKKQFNIIGFPAFLLIDPRTELVIKEWHSEIYYLSPDQFIQELQQAIEKR
jgi:thiol:disulfide interchange protein DsbD